jgi:uncharacterized protein YndB with AHSA1/START domain
VPFLSREHTMPSKKKPARKPTPTVTPAAIGRTELQVRIAADQQRVWRALVADISRWWPTSFNVGGESARMTIEPRVGGRMFEDWGQDRGVLWSTIILFDPPHRIEFAGHLTPSFGGPATSMIQIALAAEGKETVLSLTDSVFGRVAKSTIASLGEGWKMLFADSLKQYVERA